MKDQTPTTPKASEPYPWRRVVVSLIASLKRVGRWYWRTFVDREETPKPKAKPKSKARAKPKKKGAKR